MTTTEDPEDIELERDQLRAQLSRVRVDVIRLVNEAFPEAEHDGLSEQEALRVERHENAVLRDGIEELRDQIALARDAAEEITQATDRRSR